MSIIIKGMEMPKTCDDCFLPLQYCPYAMKPNGECPLVPVHPHGRLIDADALEALFWDGQCYFTENIKYKIKNIETIFPAEEGE